MTGYNYPESIEIPPIMMHELEQVIHNLPADKAPGEDGIPNRLWQIAIKTPKFTETLLQIFNACIRKGYNPSHFQRSITVVLRKQGEERDYRDPKSYRPVALLNTLGKILESIIATRISYLMERTNYCQLRTYADAEESQQTTQSKESLTAYEGHGEKGNRW